LTGEGAVLDRLRRPAVALAKAGCDEIYIRVRFDGTPKGQAVEQIERVASDVIPQLTGRYALTALAAIARVTGDLRLGIVLGGLAGGQIATAETVHPAEDLAAVDNISNGRLEIVFVPGEPGWAERAELFLGLWTDGLELSDGRRVAVTPARASKPCARRSPELEPPVQTPGPRSRRPRPRRTKTAPWSGFPESPEGARTPDPVLTMTRLTDSRGQHPATQAPSRGGPASA
jgi:alkanesulfonate monooxygenase SsuD/methylene tetrahydromethanopterin reductase-like flavin-dependent oxidoreductase (luciferase family)